MTGGFVQFTVAISRLNKLVQKIKTEGMRLFDLKGVHTLCLYQLMQRPEGMNFNEIAGSCDLDRALVSRMLKELQEKGLIRKDGEPGKYKATYFLTGKARGWVTEICRIVDEAQAFVDVGVSEEELAVFYKVLGQLTGNFERLAARPEQIFGKEKLELVLQEETEE